MNQTVNEQTSESLLVTVGLDRGLWSSDDVPASALLFAGQFRFVAPVVPLLGSVPSFHQQRFVEVQILLSSDDAAHLLLLVLVLEEQLLQDGGQVLQRLSQALRRRRFLQGLGQRWCSLSVKLVDDGHHGVVPLHAGAIALQEGLESSSCPHPVDYVVDQRPLIQPGPHHKDKMEIFSLL